ncbi:MAG: hypothetical protein ORN26_02105 [Candidatus Pacebacteria bacterium]|nr:hypothetical protein [Candidatus Paceibacterota bacterium]
MNEKQIDTLIDNVDISEYYNSGIELLQDNTDNKKIFANYLLTDAMGLLSKDNSLKLPSVNNFIKIIEMINKGDLSSRGAKDLLLDIMTSDKDPESRAKELGLIQNNDPALIENIVTEIINNDTENWNKYLAGEDKLLMYFVGKCMKSANGSGNPKIFTDILTKKRHK